MSPRVCRLSWVCCSFLTLAWAAFATADDPDPAAIERGRQALVGRGYLKPAWSDEAYRRAGRSWGSGVPDPDLDPAAAEATAMS